MTIVDSIYGRDHTPRSWNATFPVGTRVIWMPIWDGRNLKDCTVSKAHLGYPVGGKKKKYVVSIGRAYGTNNAQLRDLCALLEPPDFTAWATSPLNRERQAYSLAKYLYDSWRSIWEWDRKWCEAHPITSCADTRDELDREIDPEDLYGLARKAKR
jgi:hypothetical protein